MYFCVMSHNRYWYHICCYVLHLYSTHCHCSCMSTCNAKSHIELHSEYTSSILGAYFEYTSMSGSNCMFSEVYLKYTAVLLAFACTGVYFKYTAVLLAFACTGVYFKYTDKKKERQYTQSILYRPKYIVLKVYSVQFAQMDLSILQVY